jgi:hypothetical protein
MAMAGICTCPEQGACPHFSLSYFLPSHTFPNPSTATPRPRPFIPLRRPDPRPGVAFLVRRTCGFLAHVRLPRARALPSSHVRRLTGERRVPHGSAPSQDWAERPGWGQTTLIKTAASLLLLQPPPLPPPPDRGQRTRTGLKLIPPPLPPPPPHKYRRRRRTSTVAAAVAAAAHIAAAAVLIPPPPPY